MVHYLPDELIIPILLRLPVKSLLRFKSVSKSWFSLISDPHFALSHFHLSSSSSTHHHRLIYFPLSTYASQTRSIDLDSSSLYNDSSISSLEVTFLPPFSFPEIKGSCRGFLLLCFSSNLCLWNPSTGAIKLLSLSPISSSSSNLDIHFFTFFYGFGYDPSTDDYLVILADLESCFELFSLRANSWNQIEGSNDLPYINVSNGTRTGTLLDGVIHWIARRHDFSVNVILAFDFVERTFSEVPLPSDFDPDFTFCDLCVLGGLLCLYVMGNNATEIWVMKEYKVQSSWTKSIVVAADNLPRQFSPICTTESGDIVGLDGKTGLVKFNAKGELLEHRSYCVDRLGCQAAVYTESLLPLPVDSPQAARDDRRND